MILKEGDTHFQLGRMFDHLTADLEGWEEKSAEEKSNSWKGIWWFAAMAFGLFP